MIQKSERIAQLLMLVLLAFSSGCKSDDVEVPMHTVIAHRGASYDAPESTAFAYVLARQLGADYLECDLQRTRDGVLVIFHDNQLQRTSNVSQLFPGREAKALSEFTLAELKQLDCGGWFNLAYPARARSAFHGAKICTLEEVLNIAEGKNADGTIDPNDNGNRPGIYIETKEATRFPGIEKELHALLESRGWLTTSPVRPDPNLNREVNVTVGLTSARLLLQTFEPESLPLLHRFFPTTPKCFLLWLYSIDELKAMGKWNDQQLMGIGLEKSYGPLRKAEPVSAAEGESDVAFMAKWRVFSDENLELWLKWAKANGATMVGPASKSLVYTQPAVDVSSYMDLIRPELVAKYKALGLTVHAYTLDAPEDMARASENGVDGIFSNRTDVLMKHYGRVPHETLPDLFAQYNW